LKTQYERPTTGATGARRQHEPMEQIDGSIEVLSAGLQHDLVLECAPHAAVLRNRETAGAAEDQRRKHT